MKHSNVCASLFALLFISSICLSGQVTEAARILGLFAMPAPSHNMVFQALMKALAERGHTVEVASPVLISTPDPPSYTAVRLPTPVMDKVAFMKHLVSPANTPLNEHFALWGLANSVCEVQLASPELQKYLSYDRFDPSKKYDLVVVEMFFVDCLMGFAHLYDAPLVAIATQYSMEWANDAVGNPKCSSHVPNWFLPYGRQMTFFERLHNSLFSVAVSIYRRYVALPQQNEIAKRYFGKDMPSLWDLERNTSLVLLNGHPALSPVHPSVPNMVDVAGMHVLAKPPPLPKDLQDILDKNEKVVLFSLGSAIDANTVDQERLAIILSAMKDMPFKFLWRWGSKSDIELPPNIHASNWLPQQSILAHPHLVAFVTHGGLLSIQEAAYHGVPIVGFPFFGDQYLNLRHAKEGGFGIKMDFRTFTKEQLIDAVSKLIHDESYSKSAKRVSSIFRDQPQTPLERGIYWVEHVLRHNGAAHLRSSSLDLMWFEYYLIDVIVFVAVVLFIALYIVYKVSLAFLSLLCGRKKQKKE